MSPAQTEYQANSTSATSPNVNAKLNFSIENKGHSSSNKTQYKVVLPEGATFVTAENATGSFNEDTRELTLSINPIDAGTTRDVSYTVSLPTSVPIKKDFNANLIYQTEGINMNRKMVQETLLRKHLVIITTFDMVVIMSLLSLRVIKDKVLQMHQHNLSLSSCIKMLSIIK